MLFPDFLWDWNSGELGGNLWFYPVPVVQWAVFSFSLHWGVGGWVYMDNAAEIFPI